VKAEAAARAVGGVAVFPEGLQGDASDFNDLHQARGLDAVRAAVQAAIDAAATQPPAHAQKQRQRPGNGPAGAGDGNGDGADEAADRDPFVVNDDGVHYLGRDRDGKLLKPLLLCSRLDVAALTRDQDGNSWGFLLQFTDPQGHAKQWAMPARMLAGDGGEYRAALLNMGLRIAPSATARNRLTQYIQTRSPPELAISTDRIGWHQTRDGAAYVLPHQTIGDGSERIVFQSDSAMENTFRVRHQCATRAVAITIPCATSRGPRRAVLA
jgi:putative DNA primase/helicase